MNGINLNVMEIGNIAIVDKFVNDNNWIFCRVRDGKFDGGGDPGKLTRIIKIFKDWVEAPENE